MHLDALSNKAGKGNKKNSARVVSRGSFNIGIVNSPQQQSEAMQLVSRRYAWRGYATDVLAREDSGDHQVVLEASKHGKFFGTLRRRKRLLTEITCLAIEPEYGCKEVLASLFHLAYIHGRIVHNATDVLIEVNPRHVAYYQQKLGFRQLGEARTCARVNAPAVLLHLEGAYMDEQIEAHAGNPHAKVRSLYPYFMTRVEVGDIVSRLALAA
jgi:hypothetical protein